MTRAGSSFLDAPTHEPQAMSPPLDPSGPTPSQGPPAPTSRRPHEKPVVLDVIRPNACGIDVHSDVHVVCVPADRDHQPVRTFGAFSCDLHAIADWLATCGVTSVAMESTGVYWVPLFELLERRGFEVFLVEPGQLSRCGARPKTDVLDCQWIQRLHSYGLLRASFRPPDWILELRGYHRQRQMLVRCAARHVQHMQKALEQMNVKLTEVVADITGVTGMAIIEAILNGERDPKKLAELRDRRCAASEEKIAKALEGTWRPEHLFALKQAYDQYKFYHRQITECDEKVRVELEKLPDLSGDKPFEPKTRKRGRKSNEVRFDACGPLFKALGIDLTQIEGIDVGTALVVLAEIGVDVSKFPTEKHFASWLGLCPQTHKSNKTEKKKGPGKGKNRVAHALRLAARALSQTRTPLAQFYHRIKARVGAAGAITATAHKLARLIYRMIKYGEDYVKQDMEQYQAKLKEKLERSLRDKAAALGFELVARPAEA